MADAHPAAQAVGEQAGNGVEVDTEVIRAPSFTHFCVFESLISNLVKPVFCSYYIKSGRSFAVRLFSVLEPLTDISSDRLDIRR